MVRYTFVSKDGTKLVFREPSRTDAIHLMALINPAIQEPMSGLMLNREVGLKDERVWLKRRLSEIRHRRAVMLMVELDGKIVGNCDISRRDFKESHRAVLGIVLSKDVRGRGIGEALMRRTIDLAVKRLKGIEQIDLQTFSYNKRAQALYRKVGFVKTGEIPRAIKEGKRYYGEHVMVLYL